MKKSILLLWSVFCLAIPSIAQTIQVKWATFNIRYDSSSDGLNKWKYRKDKVAEFIKSQDIDIVGMQEVLHNQLEDLKTRLPEYTEVGVGRDDGKTKGEYSPLFFRKDKFELLDSHTFWLSQYPDSAGFIGWDGACPRIATWAKLKDKKTGRIFMAINTHFDHIGIEARKNSALLIIKKIQEIVGDRPAVLTGDFNVSDTSETYKTITMNKFVLKDAYKIAKERNGVNYTWHNWGKQRLNKREKIDFIFVTPQITVLDAYIPKEVKGHRGHLSDHNPHVATLKF